MSVWISAGYALLALIYMVLSYQGEFSLSFAVKILPLLLLFSWMVKASTKQQPWLIAALLFCMTGDVLLAWDGNALFVFGLAAFLIGHLCYLLNMRPFNRFKPALLIPYLAFAALVLTLMWPQLGAMTLPVIVYITVIIAMSFATWCSRDRNSWLILGGIVFISSDTLLGLNKFYQSIPAAGSLIMLTYYAAQYALVRGFVKRAC